MEHVISFVNKWSKRNNIKLNKHKFHLLVSGHKLEPGCTNVDWVVVNVMLVIIVEVIAIVVVFVVIL